MRDREIPLFGQSWLYMYCAPLSGADEVTGEWWPVSKCQIYGKLFFIHLVIDGQKDNIASQVRSCSNLRLDRFNMYQQSLSV